MLTKNFILGKELGLNSVFGLGANILLACSWGKKIKIKLKKIKKNKYLD
jgi:hypothetical protein